MHNNGKGVEVGASGGSAAAASIVVGNPVTGGGANRVLYEDASQNLATTAGFTFSGANLVVPGTIQTSTSGTSTTAALRINQAGAGFSNATVSGTAGGWSFGDGAGAEWGGVSANRQGTFIVRQDGGYGFSSGFNTSSAPDLAIRRASANSVIFDAGSAVSTPAGAVTSRTEINKAVASIADATPTATFTVTIPNAAHSAMLKVTLVGSLGAGGAIGANEASATISYDIAICRTAGVNAVATISSAYGSAASAVSGAATVTVTAALSAISGAVGVANTFTVNVTITKSGGSSANHTCLVYGRLMNANATGVTIA